MSTHHGGVCFHSGGLRREHRTSTPRGRRVPYQGSASTCYDGAVLPTPLEWRAPGFGVSLHRYRLTLFQPP